MTVSNILSSRWIKIKMWKHHCSSGLGRGDERGSSAWPATDVLLTSWPWRLLVTSWPWRLQTKPRTSFWLGDGGQLPETAAAGELGDPECSWATCPIGRSKLKCCWATSQWMDRT